MARKLFSGKMFPPTKNIKDEEMKKWATELITLLKTIFKDDVIAQPTIQGFEFERVGYEYRIHISSDGKLKVQRKVSGTWVDKAYWD